MAFVFRITCIRTLRLATEPRCHGAGAEPEDMSVPTSWGLLVEECGCPHVSVRVFLTGALGAQGGRASMPGGSQPRSRQLLPAVHPLSTCPRSFPAALSPRCLMSGAVSEMAYLRASENEVAELSLAPK